jgi:hypothetical protein
MHVSYSQAGPRISVIPAPPLAGMYKKAYLSIAKRLEMLAEGLSWWPMCVRIYVRMPSTQGHTTRLHFLVEVSEGRQMTPTFQGMASRTHSGPFTAAPLAAKDASMTTPHARAPPPPNNSFSDEPMHFLACERTSLSHGPGAQATESR